MTTIPGHHTVGAMPLSVRWHALIYGLSHGQLKGLKSISHPLALLLSLLLWQFFHPAPSRSTFIFTLPDKKLFLIMYRARLFIYFYNISYFSLLLVHFVNNVCSGLIFHVKLVLVEGVCPHPQSRCSRTSPTIAHTDTTLLNLGNTLSRSAARVRSASMAYSLLDGQLCCRHLLAGNWTNKIISPSQPSTPNSFLLLFRLGRSESAA